MRNNNIQVGIFTFIVSFFSFSLLQAQYPAQYASGPRFKALVYHTQHAEGAHVTFAEQGVEFFRRLNYGDGFILHTTMDLSEYSYEKLKEYDIVVMLNGYPSSKTQREAFRQYMENGGGWMGFHVAAYNDRNTNWPWFVEFLGGGVFADFAHPVTAVAAAGGKDGFTLALKDN